jgi:hypothetical protein
MGTCPECDARVSSHDRKCPLCKARIWPKKSSSDVDVDVGSEVGMDYSRGLFFLKFGLVMCIIGIVLSLAWAVVLLVRGHFLLILLSPLIVAGGLAQYYLWTVAIEYTKEKQADLY